MTIINQLTLYILVFLLFFIILISLGVILFWFYKKKRSQRIKGENTYRHLPEVDSEEFVPLDDIADRMIIEKGGKRFTASIRCRGLDFYTSNQEEKLRTKNNYVGFINALNDKITYRLYGEDINMENTIKMYQEAYGHLQEIVFNLAESYKEARMTLESLKGTGSPEEEEVCKFLMDTQKKLSSYDWRLLHIESQMRYIGKVSGPAAGRQRLVQTYEVSWQNPGGPLVDSLTNEELYKKAIVELNKECRNKIRQLNDAGVSAYRCDTNELIDMWRKHYHPISGNRYTMEDIKESVYFEDISTTDSIEMMNQDYEADLAEEIMLGGGDSV